MSFIKGFFILSVFCVGFINFGFAEDGLIFTVDGTETSFSVSSFCHPNSTNGGLTIYNYDTVSIKIGDNVLIDKNFPCNEYLSFYNNKSIIKFGYTNPIEISTYTPENGNEWESSRCFLEQIEPIVLDGGTISKVGNFKLKCDIKFKNGGFHTITIEDPLYSTENYQLGQITNIKIGLTESYTTQTMINGNLEYVNYNYSSGNVIAINQMKGLPKLKTLDLSDNKISSTDFLNSEHTNNIQEIDLSNNQISSIDNSTWKCSILKKLNLSSNKISTINFKSLTSLKYLDLSHNQLSLLENKVFSSLKGLTGLDLQGQNSDKLTIKQYAFDGLNNIETLSLQNNKIKSLEGRSFYGLTNIKSLNLENCEIESMNPDTNYSDYFSFDNFGTHTGEISVNLSNNSLNTIPTSIERLMSGHYTFLTLTNSNEVRIGKSSTPKLNLNLKKNPINYVKIKKSTITAGENTFERYGFSKDQDNPKYKRDIKDNSGNIIQSGNTNSNQWENETTVTLNEYTKGTFNVYLLNTNGETITSDSININTSSKSTINIYAQGGENPLENNNTEFKKRNIDLKFVGDPFLSSDVYYTYTIRKDSKTYITGTFTNNIYEKTFYFENGTYNLYIKMCESNSECSSTTNGIKTSKSINFTVNTPYENNILNITYPENNAEIEDTINHISRTHDWNYCNNNSFLSELSGFIYELSDKNGVNHLLGTTKINSDCSNTQYNENINNLNLPNGKYTLTIKEIDKYGNAIKSENITFQKGKTRKVSFNTNGGTTINTIEIGNGETLSKPQNPTKNGYTFLGRYTNSSLTTEYNFNSPVTQDITLYAKREKNGGNVGGGEGTSSTYTLTIYYKYEGGSTASTTHTEKIEGGSRYSIQSPRISNYTADYPIVEGTMPNNNKTITVYYTKNKSNHLSVDTTNRHPYTNEWIKLNIETDDDYTDKVYFSKLQYRSSNSSSWSNISRTSSTYVSDYSYDWSAGYYRMARSDYGYVTLNNLIKFKKSGYYRIYITDIYENESYIQIEVDDDENNNYNSEDSNLSLTVSNSQPKTYDPIDITLKTDNYIGKIKLYAKYKNSSDIRIKISNNSSSEYFSDFSNVWENGYYKITSSDKGKKTLYDLIEFKKEGSYRIYAEDEQGYFNYTSINVKSSSATIYDNQQSNNANKTNTQTNPNKYNNTGDDIDKLINQLLGNDINNNTNSNTQNDDGIERNKKNLKNVSDEIYKSRSCKEYKIQYDSSLGAFTSPNLQKTEYFINKEYFKRYIDSKNPQKEGCPTNEGWISTSYKDSSTSTTHVIAPNGKIYFISGGNGSYYSNNLTSNKSFTTLTEIKNFIKNRNPLINMETKK